jgi:hypothetical protein
MDEHINGMVETIEQLEKENAELKLRLGAAISRFDSEVFVPPFRLGRRQKRAILDAKGREVIIMPHNSEKQAQMYCDYLNGT